MGINMTQTNDVTVKRLDVSVSTIMLGSRQMTKGVFRQIKEECIFNEYGIPKGGILGYINYFWDEVYSYKDDHIHIIWQTPNGKLRRDFVKQPDDKFWVSHPFHTQVRKLFLTELEQIYIIT
jgi:hypothetical protein